MRRLLPFARPAGRPESVSGGTASPAAGALRSARTIDESPTLPPCSPVEALSGATRADPFDHSAAVARLLAAD